ncbi:MAG: glycogen synthase GlgA [Erysipelotrichia bacterium]|jgi:starch synthase|nr:glycogen synthase GlgA [Erysipelotrichia bacterium]
MKHILFVASESLPFVKTGGLADVVGSLPQALSSKNRVSVFIPLYQSVIAKLKDAKPVVTFTVNTPCINQVATILKQTHDGIDFYFLQHQGYFERDGLYGYPDDGERFSFFNLACAMFIEKVNLSVDIIHSHDWHAGMIPLLSRVVFKHHPNHKNIKHVFTIHNLAYQGQFPLSVAKDCLGLSDQIINDGSIRFDDGINFMKSAIVYAHKVTTVSPSYAQEILGLSFGERLHEVLRLRQYDLYGILNGIDTKFWDPSSDPLIKHHYDVETLDNKVKNKLELQRKCGLKPTENTLLLGVVSRLTWQKGIHLILDQMADIMGLDVQLIVLGSGEAHLEHGFRHMVEKYYGRLAYVAGYNEPLAHEIYAGCDLLLMPSLFEPCGLSQMIAMRYGTLPVVREVGGLRDSVMPYNSETQEGTGFSFKEFTTSDLYHVLRMAVYLYYHYPIEFEQTQRNAMSVDFSWALSSEQYAKVYDSL